MKEHHAEELSHKATITRARVNHVAIPQNVEIISNATLPRVISLLLIMKEF
jgi:hypothetical protein